MLRLRPASDVRTSGLVAAALALAASCGSAPATSPHAGPGRGQPTSALQYEVTPHDGGARLSVAADLPPGLPPSYHVDPSMTRWLRDLEMESGEAWSKVPFDGETWQLAGCEHGCRVRYQFDLGAAAREMDDFAYASGSAGAYLAPPSTWLLHPAAETSGVPYRFRVAATREAQFVTGVFPAAPAARAIGAPRAIGAQHASDVPSTEPASGAPPTLDPTYGADLADLPESPYSVFGRFERARVQLAGGGVDLAIVNSPLAAGNTPLVRWIDESAGAVSAYYGTFPIPHAAVIVLVEEGADIGYAMTLGNGGGSIVARVGREVEEARLLRSWMMTHEMLHLAFPNLPRKHRWLEEGMATYVEPIARARTGALTEEEVWRGMVKGMFFAQPLPGEGGLDETPTWGRIYWGGALFCLLADVRIRERTGNRRSLDDALRGILARGGNVSVRWGIDRVLDAGDEATGTTVLSELHAEMGRSPVEVDLAELWSRLGVRSRGTSGSSALTGQLVFDDGAPLAHIRRSITSPSSNTSLSSNKN